MRIVVFTGPGGSGSSTVAAAAAVASARAGVMTVLVCHAATPLTDAPAGAVPLEVESGLFALTCEAGSWDGLGSPLLEDLAGLPGGREMVLLAQLHRLLTEGWSDLVVLDGPPVADCLRLVAAPAGLLRLLDRAPASLLRRWPSATASGLSPDQWRVRLRDLAGLLLGGSLSARVVVASHHDAASRARSAVVGLRLHGVPVDEVVVTGVARGSDPARSARTVSDALAPLAVRTVAPAASPPQGPEELAELGVEPLDPAHPPSRSEPQLVADDGGYLLSMPLPYLTGGEVELGRRDDVLLVGAAGARRVVDLPGVLRRCQVVSASVGDGWLRVRFRPDPALWPAGSDHG
ncbi:MAG TPA: hypothetical protein VFJ97_07580 [Dermatophilaceae bacterium]|nr:hypothetical protein [Dermatophilaceae bacterium]